jgi:toxin ParE1/3/4
MLSIIISIPARSDITKNYEYLSALNPSIALRFFDATRYSFAEIARNPEIGSLYKNNNPHLSDLRRWYVKGFKKYLIFYRIREESIEIVRLLQGAQNIERIFADES